MGRGRQAHPLDPRRAQKMMAPLAAPRSRRGPAIRAPPPGAAPPRRHRVRFGGGRAAARARPPCPRPRQAARRGGAGVRHRVRVPRRVRVLPRDDLRRLHGRGRREGVLAVGGVHVLLRVLAHQARRRGPVDRQRLRPPRPRPRLLGAGGNALPPRRLLQKPGGDRRGDYPAGRGRHLEPDHEGRAPPARAPHRRLQECSCENGAVPGRHRRLRSERSMDPSGAARGRRAMSGSDRTGALRRRRGTRAADSVEDIRPWRPGAGGSTTTACPEPPDLVMHEFFWAGESPPCDAYRNECQTVEGQVQRGRHGHPPPARSRPRRPLGGALAAPLAAGPSPPPGRHGDPCKFGRQIICGKACDPPVWCVTFDDDEAACNNAYAQLGDPALNKPYGKCKYDASRGGEGTTPSATSRAATSATTRSLLERLMKQAGFTGAKDLETGETVTCAAAAVGVAVAASPSPRRRLRRRRRRAAAAARSMSPSPNAVGRRRRPRRVRGRRTRSMVAAIARAAAGVVQQVGSTPGDATTRPRGPTSPLAVKCVQHDRGTCTLVG